MMVAFPYLLSAQLPLTHDGRAMHDSAYNPLLAWVRGCSTSSLPLDSENPTNVRFSEVSGDNSVSVWRKSSYMLCKAAGILFVSARFFPVTRSVAPELLCEGAHDAIKEGIERHDFTLSLC